MKTKLSVLALVLVALLTGCVTADKLNDVRIGMTKDQVIALVGKPDSTSAQANIEYLTYYLLHDTSSGREQPYSVRLVDGKVESFGRFMQLFDIYNRPVAGMPTGMPPGAAGFGSVVTRTSLSLASELQRLKVLKDQGVLTEEEFQKAKQKLLSDQK